MIFKILEESWKKEIGVAVASAFLVTLATGIAEVIVEKVKQNTTPQDEPKEEK